MAIDTNSKMPLIACAISEGYILSYIDIFGCKDK
jgi:hypothetical protein